MKVIYGLGRLKSKKFLKSAVTLGVFDGVHIGHLRLLRHTLKRARASGGLSIVVTFYPHPQEELSLYSLEHRLRLFAKIKIDLCIVLKFTKYLSRIAPHRFIRDILVRRINPAYVFVGENFRFGKDAAGSAKTLKKFSQKYGFKLKVIPVSKFKGRTISSTYIRKLITHGRLRFAQRLLTRPVSILGDVKKGFKIGSRLGFPTANLLPDHEVLPPRGVYISRTVINKKVFPGVCYIGSKPSLTSFGKKPRIYVEIHIFNFKDRIYGEKIEVQFLGKIRDEARFASLDNLKKQVEKDIKIARSYFQAIKSLSKKPQHIRF
jgi:riboflavin kinase/FMN adenylyltransferase